MKANQKKVLVAGFSHSGRAEIGKHLAYHHVHVAVGMSDVRHKLKDNQYRVLVMDADRFSNDDIAAAHRLQNGARTIAVHANNSKRRAIKADGLVFVPRKHLPLTMSESIGS
ncbi:MAG: hypothetical protein HZB10_02015 [Candidatus Yonathbacteria bacterium]|nr:hypothetical protein [Candidatus Yonathbacteria bacterium]